MVKVYEILPEILKNISNGIGVSVKDMTTKYGVSESNLRKHLSGIEKSFYKKQYKYDASSKKWIAISIGFLNHELLDVEEVIVLYSILNNKKHLGQTLINTHEKVVDNYIKRTKSYIFKQHVAENLTPQMEHTFALLKKAINNNNIVEISYPKNKNLTRRKVFPYRFVFIEYYWYLICFEENKKIKSFRLSLIESPSMLEETFDYDFSHVEQRLKIAMNAYADFQSEIQHINILVAKNLVNHVELAAFFSSWKKTGVQKKRNGIDFTRFEVQTTNPDYKDIIPTLLKYMPYMIVEDNEILKDKIDNMLKEYSSFY